MDRRRAAGALLALAACIACSTAAPMASNSTALNLYDGAPEGCYYNFQHYGEGDRIMTNEPCLNCTCHNRMLMCYLRVCPFTKPIGQDCTVEKRADQCCPIVTCPDVPVDLLTSTSTSSPAEYGASGIGKQDKYGCSIDGRYFPEGSKVPPTPNKPCEHCYCIRNMTTCVMQECTLHVDGCIPIYHKDVCCPVRYSCDHLEDEIPLLDDMTTTVRPTPGFLLTTTTSPVTQVSQDCVHDDKIFADGALIKTEKACEHCYCMKGDIVCVVQECGTPMENEGKNCTSLAPRHGQCCPDTYICEGDELTSDQALETTTEIVKIASTNPPRRGIEGSGYRNEPDEPYTTDGPIFETLDIEGSGEEQSTVSIENSEKKISETQTPDLADEMFLTTVKEQESKTSTSTTEQDLMDVMVSKSEPSSSEQTLVSEYDIVTESTKEDDEVEKITESQNEDIETTPSDVQSTKVSQESLLTTPNENVFVSSGLPDIEYHYDKTTESLLKQEDDVTTETEVTNIKQVQEESTTENNYFEYKVTKDEGDQVSVTEASVTSSKDDSYDIESTSVHGVIEDFESKQTTTDILTETYKTEKESTGESVPTSTMRIESLETSSLSNTENEIGEDLGLITPTGRIPGEGDCLLNGITYKNNAYVPATNKCHSSCKCVNSIVTCDPIICSPPPEYTNMNNCQPMYDTTDSCCPTYICDHLKETVLPESHSQMSGTESPKPSHDEGCSGNDCQITEDKHSFEPSQTTVSSQPDLPPNTKLPCDENGECQVTAGEPCEGDNCKIQQDVIRDNIQGPDCKDGICVQTSSPKYEEDSLEKECNDDSCRRKESSDTSSKPTSPCSGQQCDTLPENNEKLEESSSQLPVTSEEIMETKFVDTSLSSSTDLDTIKPTEKLTTLLEETLPPRVTTAKIDSEIGLTTKHLETEVTDSGVVQEFEMFTTVKPDIEKLPEYSSKTPFETTSITSDIENKQESITTSPLDILTESSVSEEKIPIQISTDTEKEITSKTENLSTSLPISYETTSKEYSLSDDEKTTVIEKLDEIPLTTLTYDNEQVTISTQSKDNTISDFPTEPITQLPEHHGLEEKTPDDSTRRVTENTEQYSETTETSDIEIKDKFSTEGSKTSITSVDYRVTSENIKKVESLEDQPTEQTPRQTRPEFSSQTTDKPLTEEKEIRSTTSGTPVHDEDDSVFGTKYYTTEKDTLSETEKAQEELFTGTPVIDVMESLNGRGTETPSKDVEDELSTMTSQANVEIQPTLVSNIEDDVDESQPKITTTEKTKQTTQAKYEHDEETKTSILLDTETEKLITDAPTFETSASTDMKGEITTELNNEDVDYGSRVTTSIPEKIATTGRIVDDNVTEQGFDDKKDFEPLNETTLQSDKSTELMETIEISATTSHEIESLTTESSSLPTEYDSADVHEIDRSTSGHYPDMEMGTVTVKEISDDVTTQKQVAEEKYHPSTSSQTESSGTPDLPASTLNPTSEDILHVSLPQKEITVDSLSIVTLPTGSSVNISKLVTDSSAKEITTKMEEAITEKSDLTTKEYESAQTDDTEKTTLSSVSSGDSYLKDKTTETILISEDDSDQKTTIAFNSFTTEKSPNNYVDIVKDEVTGSSYPEDTKSETSVPEFTTADENANELETFTEKHLTNEVTNQEETIIEETEKTKTEKYYTESESITDSTDLNNKDEVTEKTVHEISETTDEILKATEVPDLGESEKVFSEKSEQTTLGTPEINESFEENTINIEETEAVKEYTTESIEKITNIEDNNKKGTIIPDIIATDKVELEPVTDKILQPETTYSEKHTESPYKPEYTEDILTESPELSLKTTEIIPIKDSDDLTDGPYETITIPELNKEPSVFTTEPSKLQSEKDVNSLEQEIPEQLPTFMTEADTETNKIKEIPDESTEQSTKSYIADDKDTSPITEELANDLTTNTPQFITEGVLKDEINTSDQKIPETSQDITTQTSEVVDYTKEESEVDENSQDTTPKIPELTTSNIATILTEIQKDLTTPQYLPERTTDNVVVSISDENPTERSTEYDEASTSKFSEIEDVKKHYITESPESFTTSKSSEDLSILDQTKTTETYNVVDNEKISETSLPDSNINDKTTTVKVEPEQSTDIQSTGYKTSSKPELVETTPEKELPITVKVNIDSDDETLAYTTELYAETIKEVSTDVHEDKTEKYAPTAHSEDEYATTEANDQTFSQKYHDYTTALESVITQKPDSETQSPISLSTEIQSSLATEEHHVSDGKIDDTSDYNKDTTKPDDIGTTELPASIATTGSEYSKPVTETKEEFAATTPYLVELEEHTHKETQEVSSEIYHEMEVSTVKYDTSFSEKDEDIITTEKQILPGHESETDNLIKETSATSREDIEVTTPSLLHDKIDILQTTKMTQDVSSESTQFEKVSTPSSLFVPTEHDDIQTSSILSENDSVTFVPEGTTVIYEKDETVKQEEPVNVTEKEKESDVVAQTPHDSVTSTPEVITSEDELIPALRNKTTTKSTEDATTLSPIQFDKFTKPEDRPTESVPSLSTSEIHKPGFNDLLPTDDIPSTDDDSHFPPTGSSGYGQEPDYGEEDQAFGPGTCRYGGKVYVSAQQIPRDDPCDFCFCFRSDIICLQQSCPPPIHGCHEEPIQGFCCPRYECPVSMAMTLNITTTTTTTTTTLPPHFLPHAYKGAVQRRGCQIKGHTYKVGEVVRASSGPCLHCTCGGDGQMKCDPKACTPEPILRQMIAAAVSARRRR